MEDLRAAEMETGGACRGYRGMRFTGQSPIWRRTVQDRGMQKLRSHAHQKVTYHASFQTRLQLHLLCYEWTTWAGWGAQGGARRPGEGVYTGAEHVDKGGVCRLGHIGQKGCVCRGGVCRPWCMLGLVRIPGQCVCWGYVNRLWSNMYQWIVFQIVAILSIISTWLFQQNIFNIKSRMGKLTHNSLLDCNLIA